MFNFSSQIDKLKIDDAVGAWPTQSVCGWWGTIAVGLFAEAPWAGGEGAPTTGLFFGGGANQLGIQVLGASVVAAFSAISMFIILKILKALVGLRIDEKEEIEGADHSEHGYKAYLGLELPQMNRRSSDQAIPDPKK